MQILLDNMSGLFFFDISRWMFHCDVYSFLYSHGLHCRATFLPFDRMKCSINYYDYKADL